MSTEQIEKTATSGPESVGILLGHTDQDLLLLAKNADKIGLPLMLQDSIVIGDFQRALIAIMRAAIAAERERLARIAEGRMDGEPVLLLRAQDRYAAEAVLLYAQNILNDELATPAARNLALRVWDWADEMRKYGEQHGVKYPDMPAGA